MDQRGRPAQSRGGVPQPPGPGKRPQQQPPAPLPPPAKRPPGPVPPPAKQPQRPPAPVPPPAKRPQQPPVPPPQPAPRPQGLQRPQVARPPRPVQRPQAPQQPPTPPRPRTPASSAPRTPAPPPPASAGKPVPEQVGPPPRPRKGKIGRWVALLVIAAGVGGAVWYGTRATPATEGVGDCLAQTRGNQLITVSCNDTSARFRVVGKLENRTVVDATLDACTAYSTATSAYWEGNTGQLGLVLCLEPVTPAAPPG